MNYQITLNPYQLANLKEALKAITESCRDRSSPLGVLGSGDWTWEVLYLLPDAKYEPAEKVGYMPNCNVEQYIKNANEWRKS